MTDLETVLKHVESKPLMLINLLGYLSVDWETNQQGALKRLEQVVLAHPEQFALQRLTTCSRFTRQIGAEKPSHIARNK
jgi:hypothetical protein